MRRSRFSQEQIIGVLREQEAGTATAKLCRRPHSALGYRAPEEFRRGLLAPAGQPLTAAGLAE